MVSEPCRSSPDKYWVTIPVVCEWYNDTFGTCSYMLVVFPIVCDMYGSTVDTCFVCLGGYE